MGGRKPDEPGFGVEPEERSGKLRFIIRPSQLTTHQAL